jgi:membrane-associated phospholipid phosphatase
MNQVPSKQFSRISAFRRYFLPEGLLRTYLVLGLALFALSAFAFGLLAQGITSDQSLVQFDTAVVDAIHANTSPTLIQLMFIASVAGSELLTAVSVALGILFIRQRRWYDLSLLVVAVGGEELVNTVFKFSFHRVRPTFTIPITTSAGFSFPSGHAMASVVFYGLVAYWLIRNSKLWLERVLIVLICLIVTLIIGFSRIYLGVHFPSDVFGGYVAGFAWLLVAISSVELFHRWRQKQRATNSTTVEPPSTINTLGH